MTSNSHGKYEETITYSVRKQKADGQNALSALRSATGKDQGGDERIAPHDHHRQERVEADSLQARDTRSRST